MIYSSACEYAIRALTYLATHSNKLCLVREIAESEKLPQYFLGKILQDLVDEGLLRSVKGRGGGFQLTKPPEKLTLYEIKEAVDGVADLEECAVGIAKCSDTVPCPLHETFKPLREQIKKYLKETSLANMARAVQKKKARLRRGR
mgnify:CR=1 FL=1